MEGNQYKERYKVNLRCGVCSLSVLHGRVGKEKARHI